MAGKFEGEKLDLDQLEQVVGGTGEALTAEKEDETKKKAAVADAAAEEDAPKGEMLGFSGGGMINPNFKPTGGGIIDDGNARTKPTETWIGEIAYEAKTKFANDITKGSPANAGAAMESFVQQKAMTLMLEARVGSEQANAIVWSCLAKALAETNPTQAAAGSAVEAARAKIASNADQVAKGFAAELGIRGSLTTSLTNASDALAAALVGASATVAAEIKAKAAAGYEKGLELAGHTGIGRSAIGSINDPTNVDKWKETVANAAWVVMSPSVMTPAKFLLEQMTSQATAKAIGLGDFPSEMKQTAAAMVKAFDNVEKAFIDIYKSGFVAGMTMGLDIKGIINMGQNMADMGKAIWAGDSAALGRAAQELVTDMFNDVKDGLKSFYVDQPTKMFEWTKTITMDLLDSLGATPYANIAVKETEKAFVDLGNMTRDGCVSAANAIADFAKRDVVGAFNTLDKLARDGVNGAVGAVEDVAKAGIRAATTLVNDLAKLGDIKAMESAARLIVAGAAGALSEIQGAARTVENAAKVLADAASRGSQAALNAVTDLAKDSSHKFNEIFVDGVQDAVLRGVPSAANKLADLVNAGVPYAEQAAQEVIKEGGAAATTVFNALKSAYGEVEGATKVIEWAAVYAYNEVGRSAVSELEQVAKAGGKYAEDAIEALGDAAQSTGQYANQAIDALKGLARNSEAAYEALKDVANSGVSYAEKAYNEVTDVLKSIFDKLDPRNWFK